MENIDEVTSGNESGESSESGESGESSEGEWLYFDGDKLDVTKFDKNGWDGKIYIDGNEYNSSMTVDDLVNL